MKEIMNFVDQCNDSAEKLATGIVLTVFGFVMVACFAEFGYCSAALGAISYLLILRAVGSLYDKRDGNGSANTTGKCDGNAIAN